MKKLILPFSIVLSALVSLPLAALQPRQEATDVLSSLEQIQQEFATVPCKNKERLAAARALFEKMGAAADEISVDKHGSVQNLVVTMKGTEPGIVVVGAHYDLIEAGCGAIDNWTGIVSIAHAYRSVRKIGAKKTVLFVAFGKEESGLFGSRGMASAIKDKELPAYCAMINVDSFALGRPFAMRNTSSPKLSALAAERAEGLKIPFYEVSIPGADADSSSFLARKIPAVTLSGLTAEWETVLHSKKDQAGLINHASVYLGYRLALATWEAVDNAPCDAFRENTPSLKK